jgi:hypothetical protein
MLLVEAWFAPDHRQPGTQFIHAGQIGKDKVCRLGYSLREGNRSFILLHYLRYVERHKVLSRAPRVGVVQARRVGPREWTCGTTTRDSWAEVQLMITSMRPSGQIGHFLEQIIEADTPRTVEHEPDERDRV